MMGRSLLFAIFCIMSYAMVAQDLVTIWGGAGDPNGEFAGGLNDWTAMPGTNNGVWTYTADGSGSDGAYWGMAGAIGSASVDNGAAIFNSDFLDNGGNQGQFGSGSAPSPHSGSLISPSFSCEGHSSVVVMFTQYFRVFDAITTVGVSIDGGTTWTEDTLNTDLVLNFDTEVDELQLVDFSDVAAGQSDVRIKFTFDGDYYFWIIDDVSVIEKPAYNISLGEYFMGINLATPSSQITTDSTSFQVAVTNNGANALTDLVIKASILNDANETIFEDSTTLLTYKSGSVEAISLPNLWAPGDLAPGSYLIVYEARTSDDQPDINLQDNIIAQRFFISNSVYTKEFFDDDDQYFVGGFRGDGTNYVIGNQYFTSNNWPAGSGLTATNAEFAVVQANSDGSIVGKSVTIYLLELTDEVAPDFSNFDFNAELNADNTQFKFVGIATHTFSSDDENQTLIEVELNDFETFDPGVQMKASTRYVIAASYIDAANNIFHLLSNQTPGRTGRALYYNFSTMLYDQRWFSGFTSGSSAVLNLIIELLTTVDEVPLPDHTVSIFPNPTAEHIKVDLNFEQPSKGIVILADISGKVVEIKEFPQITNQRIEFDVNNLANGTYVVRVATDEGTKTEKVIVQK